ncbi:hypothetical protein F66182_3488 [Fusarium sp. NRRL 66182]|nr:hypothetical protein F66182_3488 [Fusarium sp. NRRL 66182]
MTASSEGPVPNQRHQFSVGLDKGIINDEESEPTPNQSISASQPEKTCDPADEAKARRKIDRSVLFLLFLGLLVFQLDRMNLASALTGGFATDISVDQDTINLGNQLMFMGIVVFEILCNMALQRVGPRKWMAGQVLVFGFVATMQVFIKNRAGFLAIRLMLGFSEAGYIPGGVYTLSTWYTKRELPKRVSVFFFGMFCGNAISPILASGILRLDGARGIKGWQWLFMLEGLFTIVVSAILLLFLPGSPDIPRPLVKRGTTFAALQIVIYVVHNKRVAQASCTIWSSFNLSNDSTCQERGGWEKLRNFAYFSIEPPIPSTIASPQVPKEAHIFESKPPLPDQHPLSNRVPKPVKKLDGLIERFNRLIHTRDSHDALILFLAYASHFAAIVCETPSPKILQSCAGKFINLVLRIAPSMTRSAKLLSIIPALPSYKLRLAERLRALTGILDDWQTITRLWGLFSMWTAAKEFMVDATDSRPTKEEDEKPLARRVKKTIEATYILSLIGYFGLENIEWLSRRGVLKCSEKTQSKLMLWSLRGLSVSYFAELAQLLYGRACKRRDGEDEDADSRTEWNRKFVQLMTIIPVSVHWARPAGLLPEILAGLLAAYSEFINVKGLWKETAVI